MATVVGFAVFSLTRMLPPQPYGLAADWRVFYAAASVVSQGGNPYDSAVISAAEQRADTYPAVQPAIDDFTNPAPVAWVLQPVARMPFWTAYLVFTLLSAAAALAALVLWLRALGWRRPAGWAGLALLSWPALVGLFDGQFDLLMLALALAATGLATRGRPALAGSVAVAAAMFKPHILWPLPLLLAAAEMPDRRATARLAGAAVATALSIGVAGELLMPGSSQAFVSHVLGFGGRVAGSQPDLAGLPGLIEALPVGPQMGLAIAVAGVAATLAFAGYWARAGCALALSKPARTRLAVTAGLAIWLLATPYAHPNDDVLLLPLVALLLGPDGNEVTDRQLLWAMLGCLAVVTTFLTAPVAGALLVIGGAAVVWLRRRGLAASGLAAAAMVSLAVLPTAWPFHLIAVSLTPLAVLLVTLAGGLLVRRALAATKEPVAPSAQAASRRRS